LYLFMFFKVEKILYTCELIFEYVLKYCTRYFIYLIRIRSVSDGTADVVDVVYVNM
jgi:hypothetical protein